VTVSMDRVVPFCWDGLVCRKILGGSFAVFWLYVTLRGVRCWGERKLMTERAICGVGSG